MTLVNQSPTVIDWTPMLGFECQLVLSSWEQGLTAVTDTPDGKEILELHKLGDWLLENSSESLKLWRDTIPNAVRAALNQVPDRRLEILQLAHANRHAQDLLMSTPLLLWLLMEGGGDKLEALLPKKQVAILAVLGFGGSKQQIKALRAIGAQQPSRRLLQKLLPLLGNQACLNYWSHNNAISIESLEVLVAYPWLADCPAKALIEPLVDSELRRMFRDTMGMLEDLARLQQCATPRSVVRLHDELVGVVNRHAPSRHLVRDDRGEIVVLPEAPLKGTERIVYLSDQRQIIYEGRKMQHCIASYLARVAVGRYFVYHYDGDSELTIGINGQSGHFRIDDV